jgi:hypothetical protein
MRELTTSSLGLSGNLAYTNTFARSVGCGRAGQVHALSLPGDWVQTPNVNTANGIVCTSDGPHARDRCPGPLLAR